MVSGPSTSSEYTLPFVHGPTQRRPISLILPIGSHTQGRGCQGAPPWLAPPRTAS